MAEETRSPNLQPVALVLVALLWFFTMTGGRQIFVNEVLGKAYDSQAEHFLRGDVGVDGDAIRHEIMIVNDKPRMYFGPFPAFLRIPLNYIYPGGRGNWSRISGFCAGMIALAAFAALVRNALRASKLSSGWRNWLGNASLVGFALGSPLLLLLGNLSIYDEAIIWALAWSLAALYFALRSREAEGSALTRSLLALSFCAGAALLSRATFGAPFLLIAPVLALRLFRRNPVRNLAALFLPLGAAFLFYLFLTYARFGDFSGMPMRFSANQEQQKFALEHGLFRLERVPYSFADYFILRRPVFQDEPPFLKASREPYESPDSLCYAFHRNILFAVMVLVVDSARRRDWHGNAASAWRFRWSRPHDCGDSFAAGYRHSVVYGPRATLPCGILSISYFRFSVFSTEWPTGIPVALPAYCTGCCVGCY